MYPQNISEICQNNLTSLCVANCLRVNKRKCHPDDHLTWKAGIANDVSSTLFNFPVADPENYQ